MVRSASPLSTYSFTVLLLTVSFLGFSLHRWHLLLFVAVPFLVLALMSCCLLLGVFYTFLVSFTKLFIWHARNDFRFCDIRSGPSTVIKNVKARVSFDLTLHSKGLYLQMSKFSSSVGWLWCCSISLCPGLSRSSTSPAWP